MAQFEVRRDRQLVGSLNTDNAELVLEIHGSPCREERLTVNYQLYRTSEGCIVRVTEHCLSHLGPAELISATEAIELCQQHDLEIPKFLATETQPSEVPRRTERPESDIRPNETCHEISGFTDIDLTNLQKVKSALYGLDWQYGELCCECGEDKCLGYVGFSISVLAEFCSRIGTDEIQSARRVPCRSAAVLCNSSEAVLASCTMLGLDGYFACVAQTNSQFDPGQVPYLIAVSFGVPVRLPIGSRFESVGRRASKTTVRAKVRKQLGGGKLSKDLCQAFECTMQMALALSQNAREVCGSKLTDLPIPPNIVTAFRSNQGGGNDSKSDDASESQFPDAAEVADCIPPRRRSGAFYRDFKWLFWHRTSGLREGEIRDRWNELAYNERLSIASNEKAANKIADGKPGWDLVNKGLAKAADELTSFVRTTAESS